MKKLKLKQNEVVHCATLKQAKKVLNIAHNLGYKWCNNISYKKNNDWDLNKEATVYYLYKGKLGHVEYVKEEYTIITSKEFIKRHKKTSLKKRIKALEAIVGAANESKNGWYKWKDTNYLMYHDFTKNTKFGFGVNGEWVNKFKAYGNLEDYTEKVTHKEVIQRLIGEAAKRGFNIDCQINCKNGQNFPAILNEFEYVEEENKLLYSGIKIMKDGIWENCKPYEKKPLPPQIGDVVKAWDNDKSKFVYGVLNYVDPYVIGTTYYGSVEKVTEISINDFKK